MFQQHGYKTSEFRRWISSNFNSKVITTEHLLLNLVILVVIYFFAERITFIASVIIMAVFTVFWFGSVHKYRPEKDKKPLVVTNRVKRLLITFLILIAPLYYFIFSFSFSQELFYANRAIRESAGNFITADPYFLTFLLAIADILILFLIFPAAWFMKPIENQIQEGFKKQAREKLSSMPDLKVIAITGSYGKTSTKFIIDAFLKERYRVCTTPGSYNTPMGICKVINNDLETNHQVLILEMGARYTGNIKELCDIAKPDISVITNVGVSHLETFGSKEAVANEKATLARELKPGGKLILNGDDPVVLQMGESRSDINRIITGENGAIRAENVETGPSGTSFDLNWLDEDDEVTDSEKIITSLLGIHNVQNILLGAAVARELNLRLPTIRIAASQMKPVEHRLELKQRNGITVIDDAFNSNPQGAKNAVEILASFNTGRKILITPGMIELGELEEKENHKFGELIAIHEIDLAILVGHERTIPIKEGIESARKSDSPEVKIADTLFEANEMMSNYVRKGDVVLYENDLPDTYNES